MSFPAESMAGRAVDRGGVPLENAMRTRTSAWLASALVAGSLGLLSAGVADAAAFRVGFDPQFSATGSLDNLGFSGTGVINIDNGCFASSGEIFPNPSSSCKFADFTSLTLDLYDFSNPPPATTPETLSFVPPLSASATDIVSKIVVGPPGQLVGIDTPFIGAIFASAIPSALPADSYVWMRFASGYSPITYTISEDFIGGFTVSPNVFLRICTKDNIQDESCQTSTGQATVTFTRVPEPATGLLALTALGALGWVRRRRSRG